MKYLIQTCVICSVILLTTCTSIKKSWERAQSKNNISSYKEFLSNYPESEYSKIAREKLSTLYFAAAKSASTIKAYEEFLNKYPDSQFSDEAKKRIESLEYDAATKNNKIISYEKFVAKYPKSKFKNKIQENIGLLLTDAYKDISEEAIEYLRTYPDGIYKDFVLRYATDNKNYIAIQELKTLVKVDKIQPSESVETFTGRFMDRGVLEPIYETLTPQKDNLFLLATIIFKNYGDSRKFNKNSISFEDGKQNHYHAFYWYETDIIINKFGEYINIDDHTVITIVTEIPKKTEINDLNLKVENIDLGKIGAIHRISFNEQILSAASKGDAVKLRRLLDSGGNVNAKMKRSRETALMLAAENGHIEAVRVLLEYGADVNATASKAVSVKHRGGIETTTVRLDWTALDAASTNGHASVVVLLKKAGSNK